MPRRLRVLFMIVSIDFGAVFLDVVWWESQLKLL